MSAPRNIILLSADALRSDHLSCYGYDRETSPFLDDFAESNIRFQHSYSGSANTREGVPALITGKYPDVAIGANYRLDTEPIASVLRNSGYETGAFHSNPYASRAYGMDRGFDKFDDDLNFGKNKWLALAQRAFDKLRNKHYVRADEINERSLSWLDEVGDSPFFLWNHYMDTHGPYEPVPEFRKQFESRSISDRNAQQLYQRAIRDPESITDDELDLLINLYDAEILYLDSRIERFIAALDERGLLDNSLIVFTADHGDAFGEHGYFEHPRYLHDELVRVPMIVSTPDSTPIENTTTAVSTLDVAATMCDYADIEWDGPGESLLALAETSQGDRIVFSQIRGEDEDKHVRRYAARDGSHTAYAEYDAKTEAITITETDSRSLSDALREHIRGRVDNIEVADEDDDIDDSEINRRLTALGYKE